jgi:hypothetical protein
VKKINKVHIYYKQVSTDAGSVAEPKLIVTAPTPTVKMFRLRLLLVGRYLLTQLLTEKLEISRFLRKNTDLSHLLDPVHLNEF